MTPAQWTEESRDALRGMTEFERMTGCGHRFGPGGDCAYCETTAEEAGF